MMILLLKLYIPNNVAIDDVRNTPRDMKRRQTWMVSAKLSKPSLPRLLISIGCYDVTW